MILCLAIIYRQIIPGSYDYRNNKGTANINPLTITMNRITEITRRDIIDLFREGYVDYSWLLNDQK